jgi:DNA modification methylase
MTDWRIIDGDCRDALRSLDAGSVHTCVTSPPYYGLRDYGHGDGQDWAAVEYMMPGGTVAVPAMTCALGLEPTPDAFVGHLLAVFRDVRRVLRDDATVWLNLGDSYAGSSMTGGVGNGSLAGTQQGQAKGGDVRFASKRNDGCKPKDLLGIPWLVAFALRADGWYLRSEIIWHKPNPMPESVTDRPTKSHEQVFLLSKRPTYYYDADAIREAQTPESLADHLRRPPSERSNGAAPDRGPGDQGLRQNGVMTSGQRNKRSVWTIATQPYAGAHFATFPPKLIEPCILAGCPEGGTVLDPFAGAGTTGMVALRHGRSFTGIELNPEYAELARDRIETDQRLGYRAPKRVTIDDGQASIFDALDDAA